MSRARGTALVEFALVWPIVLLTVLASVQVGLWATAAYAARAAALAGARTGATSAGSASAATAVTRSVLAAALPATAITAWCPPGRPPQGVWICAADRAGGFEVRVGGGLAPLVPLAPGRGGLDLHADALVPNERFQ